MPSRISTPSSEAGPVSAADCPNRMRSAVTPGSSVAEAATLAIQSRTAARRKARHIARGQHDIRQAILHIQLTRLRRPIWSGPNIPDSAGPCHIAERQARRANAREILKNAEWILPFGTGVSYC